ncbi:MAG: hypothetical protein AB1454_06315 [Candidatus Auribacterota bacterium]
MNTQPVQIHTSPGLKELAATAGGQMFPSASGISYTISTIQDLDDTHIAQTEKQAPSFYVRLANDVSCHSRIIAFISRLSPYDVLLTTGQRTFDDLRQGSVIGVHGSFRERQIRHLALHADVIMVKPPVSEAVKQLSNGTIDGLVISDAERILTIPDGFTIETFSPQFFIPEPFQGIVCVQAGKGTEQYHSYARSVSSPILEIVHDAEAGFKNACIQKKRSLTGALCIAFQDKFTLYGSIFSPDGTGFVQGTASFTSETLSKEVSRLAETLLFHSKGMPIE